MEVFAKEKLTFKRDGQILLKGETCCYAARSFDTDDEGHRILKVALEKLYEYEQEDADVNC